MEVLFFQMEILFFRRHTLFKVFEKPLKMVKSPYILLLVAYFIVQFLVLFIPSHAGLALLLMVTMYPILVLLVFQNFLP